jgi:hypothetical protein
MFPASETAEESAAQKAEKKIADRSKTNETREARRRARRSLREICARKGYGELRDRNAARRNKATVKEKRAG